MKSPWGESNYSDSGNNNNNDDRTSSFITSHGFLGSLIERSTSAPPLSSEGGLSFGDAGSSLFGREREREQNTMAPLYESRNRDDRSPDITSPSATFLARPQAGRAGSSYPKQPDFSSLLSHRIGSENAPELAGQNDRLENSFTRAGAELIRSQSAAPTFHGRSLLYPPPGLAEIKESQLTPATVDSYSTGSHSNNGSINNTSESAVDHRHADIMQLGQRRPASTGVIGLHPSPGTGAGHRLNGLMDLIQEDDVSSNSRSGMQQQYLQQQQDNFGSYSVGMQSYINNNYTGRDSQFQQQSSTMNRSGVEQQYMYAQQQQLHPHMQQEQQNRGGVSLPDNRMQQQGMQQSVHGQDPYGMGINDTTRNGQPQYVTLQDHGLSRDSRGHSPMYATAALQGIQTMHRGGHPQQDAQTQIYFNSQPTHRQVDLQSSVITQNGQTVYLNSQPIGSYGYAPVQQVQYHPHHQQPQIIRQPLPGNGHPQEQYVQIIPAGGGPPQLVSLGGGGGGQTYAYYDANGAQIAVPQVTIMNAGPGGAPIAVTRLGNPLVEPPSNSGYGGGGIRGKEKGGKGRRGGGNQSSRRGGDGKRLAHSATSPLLEEFRATKSRDWTIRDIEGHVVDFCEDQNGSRFIQQRLETGDTNEQKIVMNEVLPAIQRLRNDVFGNYVVQKLLEFGTPQMKADIRDTLQGEMLQLSLQMYGCRVVQKALEALDEDDLPRLLKEFHHNVLSCIHDQNGNHVIQKCIEVMSNKIKRAREMGEHDRAVFLGEQLDFVVDDVLFNTASLSCHPYGCRVLQRVLEHCVEGKKIAALDEIRKCHKALLDDQYGNYVIQHVLQFGRESDRESILRIVAGSGLLCLSKQKFASNVVEKLLKYGTDEQRKVVVREMLKVVDDETRATKPAGSVSSSVVMLMVRDAYANYVVQTTLDVLPECEEKTLLMEELKAHATELRNYTFAKHIMTKLNT